MQISKPLTFYIPDTRKVVRSNYGLGNLKIGPDVFTYSRLPGRPRKQALGLVDSRPIQDIAADDPTWGVADHWPGTCPGSTPECERICYAARVTEEMGDVASMWLRNTMTDAVPPIPEEAKILRFHVSGDFNSVTYVSNWITRISARPDVQVWGYTRSWRVPELLQHLENLRALPNVQLFASMDKSTPEMPPDGWRRAWIDGDPRAGEVYKILAHTDKAAMFKHFEVQDTGDHVKTLICPEETFAAKDCQECGFCFAGPRNDVTFLEH